MYCGITDKNIILIVNKMDLIDFNQTKFNEVVKKILNFTKDFDFNNINKQHSSICSFMETIY